LPKIGDFHSGILCTSTVVSISFKLQNVVVCVPSLGRMLEEDTYCRKTTQRCVAPHLDREAILSSIGIKNPATSGGGSLRLTRDSRWGRTCQHVYNTTKKLWDCQYPYNRKKLSIKL
jgi:hypothetical protein